MQELGLVQKRGIQGLKYIMPRLPSAHVSIYSNDVSEVLIVVVLVAELCLTLCDPTDCSPPGSSVGILQARILEWVAISFSRGSSRPRD